MPELVMRAAGGGFFSEPMMGRKVPHMKRRAFRTSGFNVMLADPGNCGKQARRGVML